MERWMKSRKQKGKEQEVKLETTGTLMFINWNHAYQETCPLFLEDKC